ncbi:hypothetical protein ABZY44_23800 [Streptomyces sp. NPDC006544]|uniref:hypothetical protein n=1 Tax=Streptomyces sp. NPDC006544 TaxID=3154583 RepID=UPI0033B1C5A7
MSAKKNTTSQTTQSTTSSPAPKKDSSESRPTVFENGAGRTITIGGQIRGRIH